MIKGEKILVLFVLSLIYSLNLFGVEGRVIIESKGNNILYHGIKNRVIIAVEGLSCETMYLEIDSGYLQNLNCSEKFIVPYSDICNISVYSVENGDTVFIEKKSFLVKELPMPFANILGKTEGSINKGVIKVIDKIGLGVRHELKFPPYKVCSFNLIIISDNKVSNHFINKDGGNINKEMKTAINLAKKGDFLYFSSILAQYPNGKLKLLAPISLMIK